MCGIVGIWKEANDLAVARMAQSVAHRGPDGLDWITMGDRSLGASRLAIFGDPTAPAIFCDPETRTAVLLNGEIYCSRDKTLFEGVHQVEPGTAYIFRENGASIMPFASFPRASYLDEAPHMDYPAAVAQLRERIIQGMDLLLSHGDHQVGLFLSGGVDSTTLALVARAILGRPLMTFTLSDSPDSPDILAAREVASRMGTCHLERRVSLQDYFARLKHFVTHYECLVTGGVFDLQGGMAFHLLSETISEHVRVALSGEGADELFGGYYWIHTHPLGFADRIRRRLESYPVEPELHQVLESLFPLPEDERTYKRNIFDFLIRGDWPTIICRV